MDNELLQAISDMMDSKLEFIKANMATKDDLRAIEIKVNDTFDELMNVEKQLLKDEDDLKELKGKVDTLLLKEDTTAVLLRRIDNLEKRVTEMEKKIS